MAAPFDTDLTERITHPPYRHYCRRCLPTSTNTGLPTVRYQAVGTIGVSRMNDEFKRLAIAHSHGGEVTHVASRQPTDVDPRSNMNC
jgi:hypothetical protein